MSRSTTRNERKERRKSGDTFSLELPMPTKHQQRNLSIVVIPHSSTHTHTRIRILQALFTYRLEFGNTSMTHPVGLQRRLGRENIFRAKKRTLMDVDRLRELPVLSYRQDTEDDAAQLLLSMCNIVTNEIKNDSHAFDDEGDKYCSSDDDSSRASITDNRENLLLTPPEGDPEGINSWTRARSISIDSPQHHGLLPPTLPDEEWGNRLTLASLGLPALISPNSTPVGRGRPLRRASLKLAHKARRECLKVPKLPQLPPVISDIRQYKKKAMKTGNTKGVAIKTIGRKKFSWKNYPELEAFMIANREEYLRHSALNYTVQQKIYNNKLTEQLLEIASEHGYVFDEDEFSFVTVRDRIRCYFKSYVQSAKKRGITVGYAARKAGLLTEDDLRVEQEGQIVVPEAL